MHFLNSYYLRYGQKFVVLLLPVQYASSNKYKDCSVILYDGFEILKFVYFLGRISALRLTSVDETGPAVSFLFYCHMGGPPRSTNQVRNRCSVILHNYVTSSLNE